MNRGRFNWGVVLVALGAAMWGTDALWRPNLLPIMSSQAIVFAEHLVLALYSIPAVVLGWPHLRRLRPLQWGALILIGWGASGLATVLFTEGFRLGDPTTVECLPDGGVHGMGNPGRWRLVPRMDNLPPAWAN